jgi:Lon protease-like protein
VTARLRTVLALASEAGDDVVPATIELSPDPVLAGHQIAAVAPLGALDQQALLSAPTCEARLDRLVVLLDDVEQILRLRLAE